MFSLRSDEITSNQLSLPFRTNHGFIVWSLINAVLGAHGTFTLLSRSEFTVRHKVHQDRFRVTAAAFSLCLGFWSSQLTKLRGSPLFSQWSPSLNPGFVVLSFIVPFTVILLVLSLFSFIRRPHRIVNHVISGILCGCAVSFSNYALCLSVNNIRLRLAPAQSSLSVLLSVSISLFSFLGFSILLSKRKYCLCAQHFLSLAFGVSVVGASLLAQEGTTITFYPQDIQAVSRGIDRTGSAMIAVSTVATFVLSCLCLYLYETRNQIAACEKVSIPKLSITSVSFASDGRVLVNEDGTLPSREIDLVEPLLDYRRDLQPHGDIFQWLFSLSFDWNIVQPFLPFTKCDPSRRKIRDVLNPLLSIFESRVGTESSPRASFKLHVLETIACLAADLDIPLCEIGYLYDLTLTTGDYLNVSEFLLLCERDSTQFYDAEKALRRPDGSTETGLMLFFIRNLPESVPLTDLLLKYSQKDYKLAFMRHVRNSLIDSVAATPEKVDQVLVGCREYMTRGTKATLEPGKTYLSLHAERTARNGTREILVYDFAKHQIPSFRLDIHEMTDDIRSWITNASGLSAEDLQALCRSEIKKRRSTARYSGSSFTSIRSQTQTMFEYALANALQDLSSNLFFLPDMLDTARLNPEVVEILIDDGPSAYMIVLQMEILDGPDDDMSMSSRVDLFPTSILSKPIIPFTFTFAPKSLHELSGTLIAGMSIDLQYTLCIELQRLLRSCGVIVNHADLARTGTSPFSTGIPLISSFSLDTVSLESMGGVDQLPTEKPVNNLVTFLTSIVRKTLNHARISRTSQPKPLSAGMVEVLPRPLPAMLAPDRTPGPPISVHYFAELEQNTSPRTGIASGTGFSKHPYLHLRLPSPLLVANPLLSRRSNMNITSATN